MTTADVTSILAALADLSSRMTDMVERLARIEERTMILNDHEIRIRSAEDAARVAGEVAAHTNATAENNSIRIRALEDKMALTGKFTIGIFPKIILGTSTVLVGITSVILAAKAW